jgi:O-antigen/teichoic acid export membrane protein
VLYCVSGIVGLAATGALRAAQLLLNPLHVLTQGVRLVAIPDAVRMLKRSEPAAGASSLRRQGMHISVGMWTAAMGLGVVAYLLPTRVGTELLGATWSAARPLIIPITISTAFGGVVSGASVGLRALAAARRSRLARTIMSSLQLIGGLAGAAIAGASGAAWGLAAANVTGAAVWWWHLRGGMREHIEAPGALGHEVDLPVPSE